MVKERSGEKVVGGDQMDPHRSGSAVTDFFGFLTFHSGDKKPVITVRSERLKTEVLNKTVDTFLRDTELTRTLTVTHKLAGQVRNSAPKTSKRAHLTMSRAAAPLINVNTTDKEYPVDIFKIKFAFSEITRGKSHQYQFLI
ncbi:hypothetical protein GOODEAATRI_031939 [Goodea atripinnis]|uniref:Uncharacterized protein n=1 Tax=Goodea atripinnis TaxID=208336 RepID=A0ABV0N5V9_9TELE